MTVVLGLVLAALCIAAASSPAETTIISTYTISGRAVDQATGAGIAGVMISNGMMSTVTDMYGYYLITNVLPGSYGMSASKDGWQFMTLAVCIDVPPDATFNFLGASEQQQIAPTTDGTRPYRISRRPPRYDRASRHPR